MVQYNRLTSDSAIIDYLKKLEQKIDGQTTKGSGDIIITDPDTGVETIIGTLPDGTTGLQEFVGDIEPPPVTTAPIVSAEPGNFIVSWDGQFLGGMTAPRDFVHVNVIGYKISGGTTVLTVPVGVIRTVTESVFVSTDIAVGGETWEFALASEDYNGNVATESARSASIMMIDAVSTVSDAWINLNTEVSNAQTAASNAQTAAEAAQNTADQVALDQTASAQDIAAAQEKADQAFNNAAAAATAAGNAQTSADNKNRIWYQDSPPTGTGHKLGDTWFDTNDGNKIYLWSGATPAWNSFQDTAITTAQNAADTATVAASGKSTVNFSTASPSGTGTRYGDIWFKRDATGTIIGQWEWVQGTPSPANDAWQPRIISESVLSNISAGKIVAGWLQAGEIKAGSITADKLTITDFTNLVDDPDFIVASGNYTGWLLIPQATIVPTVGVEGTTNNALKVIANGTINDINNKSVISTQAGEKYYGEIYVKQDGTGNTGLINFAATVKLADGTLAYPTFQQVSSSSITTTWSKLSGVITIPTNGVSIKARVSVRNSATNGIFYFQHAVMRRQVGATSIAAGAITTSHITASTLDASVLSAGTITSTKIAAKSIGVDKLLISSTDNLLMEADFSNGGTSWQLSASNFISPAASRSGVSAMRFTGFAGTITSFNLNNKIPISPDARFRGSMWVKPSVAMAADTIKIVGRFYYNLTQFNDIVLSSNVPLVADVWAMIDGIIPATIPANTIAAEFYISVTNVATGDIVDIDFISVARAADGKLIVDGTITAEKLESSLILASEIIAGDPLGTHAQMDGAGFRVYAGPGDGSAPYETVRMGVAATDDLFTITNSVGDTVIAMDSTGVVAGRSLEASDSLYYKGDELTSLIDTRPRGLAAWGSVTITSNMSVANGELGLFEIGWDTSTDNPARMYEFNVNQFILNNTVAGIIGVRLRYTTDGSVPTINSPLIGFSYFHSASTGLTTTGAFTRLIASNNGPYVRVLLSIYNSTSGVLTVHTGSGQTHLYTSVKDVGILPPSETVSATTAGGTPFTGSVVAAPTAPKVTKTVEYGYFNVKSYLPSGAHYNFNTTKAYQGLSPAGTGNLSSMYGFNQNFASLLSGATINGIWVYLYFEHWYYNAGGTAYIRLHNNLTAPTTNVGLTTNGVNSGSWPKGAGRWVALPSSLWSGFASGAYKGFGLVGDGTYASYGIANNARIKIQYTK